MQLIKDAVALGQVERWRDSEPVATLDPVQDKHAVIGLRLTVKGQARARTLEARHEPSLPLEAICR